MRLGSGINLGNALDAADGDEHALRLPRRYSDEIKAAGSTRSGCRWRGRYTPNRPLRTPSDRTPDAQTERFLALWRQIAPRYADRPELLHFELLNEPRAAMTAQRWNALLPHALAAVRESNPERTVLIGPAEMNDIRALPELELPDDDHLVATVPYYAPFEFTQGAHWVENSAPWLGTTWGGEADRKTVSEDLAAAAAWADAHAVPLFLGEFGAYERADMDSRVRWTAWVREEAERLGISWAYWEFGTDFGAYARETDTWREPLRQALIPQ
ncbi:glycoside hydrolase family 5 protein [Streptomyces sp. NBC_01231]|nr:glycoside hydrolase family 5 protein [Streptomyces sp. NBC_01231]